MNTDYRMQVGWSTHPKFLKLENRLGDHGVVSYWRLIEFVAVNKPDGKLINMDEEDITLAARFRGSEDFVATLIDLRLMDRSDDGELSIHDWRIHNPFAAGAEERSGNGRFAVEVRWENDRRKKAGQPAMNAEEVEAFRNCFTASSQPSPYGSNTSSNTPRIPAVSMRNTPPNPTSESVPPNPTKPRTEDEAYASAAGGGENADSGTDPPQSSDTTPLGLEANRAYQDRFKHRYAKYRKLLPEETRQLKSLRKAGETDFYRAIDAFFGSDNQFVCSQSHGVGLLKAGWGDVWLTSDPVGAANRKWPPRGSPKHSQPARLADQVDGMMQRMEERKTLFRQGEGDGR